MEQTLHDYVVTQLQAKKGSWPQLAREIGMSVRTVTKIAQRVSKHPRIDNIERLARYFRQRSAA